MRLLQARTVGFAKIIFIFDHGSLRMSVPFAALAVALTVNFPIAIGSTIPAASVKIAPTRFRGRQFYNVRLRATVLSVSRRGTVDGTGECCGKDAYGSASTDFHRHDRISCASDIDCATSLTVSRTGPSPSARPCRHDSQGTAAPE
jgi:hypothetical protein